MSKLSIIIPCYNCVDTLTEAVESCFTQNLNDFEIVMVDDGSTDNTIELIKKLKEKYQVIRIFKHDKNLGGGATRNTAVANTAGEIIFCIDSDDILVPDTLPKMLAQMQQKNCDGVVFSGSYSFSKNKNRNNFNDFKITPNKPISLIDIFSGKSWGVGANFMYTKKAFEKTGGYPTQHSFDTQGYGFRFIASGGIAYVCKDTFFYQRQFADKKSYFERAYLKGEFSIGHAIIFREYIGIFSGRIQKIINDFDIYNKNTLSDNILSRLQSEYARDPDSFFGNNKFTERTPVQIEINKIKIKINSHNHLRPSILFRLVRKVKKIYENLHN